MHRNAREQPNLHTYSQKLTNRWRPGPHPKRRVRTVSRRFRTVSCTKLPPHGDADASYVGAVVKGPQRNCVFAAAGQGQVQRIPLMRTVGNTVVGKDLVPRAAIDADVRALDA